MRFSALEAQINVHLVRQIFRGRGNFISGFLESVYYFFYLFFCAEYLKKSQPTYGPCPSQIPSAGGFISRSPSRPEAQVTTASPPSRNPNPSPTARQPAAAATRPRRRQPPPPSVFARKPISFFRNPRSRFLFQIGFFQFRYLANVRSYILLTNGFHRLTAESKRSFISLFVSFLFPGFFRDYFRS